MSKKIMYNSINYSMKTQIIRLEPHDTLISTQDKITWAQNRRILLVWPDHYPILNRVYDLVILQRHADSLGAPLGIVSTDGEVRQSASRLKIPAFRSIRQAQRSRWKIRPSLHRLENPERIVRDLRGERPQAASRNSITVIKAFFTLCCLVALIAAVALFLPEATITFTPQIQDQRETLSILAVPETTDEFPSGTIAYQVRTMMVEGELSRPTSGSVDLPDEYAAGMVRFTNQTKKEIDVPAGTIVSSSTNPRLEFITSQAGIVPAKIGGTVDIPVQASQPGKTYNLAAGKIDTINDEESEKSLTITNPAAFSGGSGTKSPVATVYDQDVLKEDLLANLENQAWEALTSNLAEGDQAFRTGLVLLNVSEESFNVSAGDPADTITLVMKAEYSMPVISAANLQTAAATSLDRSLPDGYLPEGENMQIEAISSPEVNDDGTIRFEISAERQINQVVDEYQLVRPLLGVKTSSAVGMVSAGLGASTAPSIVVQPGWWPWMPVLAARIQVSTPAGE